MLSNRVLSIGIAAGLLAAAGSASDGIGNLSLSATSCNPEIGATVSIALCGQPGMAYTLRVGQPGGSYIPGVGPVDLVLPTSSVAANGVIPASGVACVEVAVSYPDLTDVVFQGFASDPSSPTGMAVSNPARVEVSSNPSIAFVSGASLMPVMPAVNARRVVYGDVDRDGDLDVYVPTVGDSTATTMEVRNLLLLNSGSGLFVNATTTHLPAIVEASNRALLADLDGDFDLDVVTANGKRSVVQPVATVSRIYTNDGTGHFTASEVPGGADYVNDVAAGDVDGDGDVDLVLGRDGNGQGAPERLLINNGTGSFTDAGGGGSSSTQGGSGGNGNGGGHGNGRGGNGSGGSDGGTTTAVTGITAIADKTISVNLVDIDTDGDSDLVTANADAGGARVYLNNGMGLFTALAGAFPASDSAYASDLALGDIDGDGDLDAFMVIRTLVLPLVREARVFLNDGNGVFARAANAVTGIPANDEVFHGALGDVDGDGDLDAVVVTSTQALDWLLLNDGVGHFAAAATGVAAPIGTGSPVFFDATGDNVLDIVYAANSSQGTVKMMVRD